MNAVTTNVPHAEGLPMIRALLILGALAGAVLAFAGINERDAVGASKVIAGGVGLLAFLAGLGLADLINVTYEVRSEVLGAENEIIDLHNLLNEVLHATRQVHASV